tara:strand:- start:506 stop:829 length:324 start_codon:yes stop_codon:yes gene_type:complete
MKTVEEILEVLKTNMEDIYNALQNIHKAEPTVEELRAMLKEKGYCTDNLWCIEDLTTDYRQINGEEIDDDTAHKIMYNALTNEATYDQIWYAIHHHAEEEGFIIPNK